LISNGRGGLLTIKSVQRLGLFGQTKNEILEANLWEVFQALDMEVAEDDYREQVRKNRERKK
jgi:hypothetical protein